LPPSAAEFYIETTLDSLILLRKINESSVVSNYYLARSAVKNLFTQPQIKSFAAKPRRHLVNSCEKHVGFKRIFCRRRQPRFTPQQAHYPETYTNAKK
jgi:hypothetical protein